LTLRRGADRADGFEDAHWIDPTSRELLDLFVDRVRRLSVLVVITFRPEFRPVGRLAQVTSLLLNRLGEGDGETGAAAGSGHLPQILSPRSPSAPTN
jgi:hypothetical protein